MTEADVQRTCIEYLWRIGWLVIRVNSGANTQTDATGKKRHYKFCTWYAQGHKPQSAGVSDILAIEPGTGRLWAIECKAPGKLDKMTGHQSRFQAEARGRGAVAICVDDLDLLIEAIEREKR